MKSALQFIVYVKIFLALSLGSCVTVLAGTSLVIMIITGEIRQIFTGFTEFLFLVAFFLGIYLLMGGVASWRGIIGPTAQGHGSPGMSSRGGCVVAGVKIFLGLALTLIGGFFLRIIVAGGSFHVIFTRIGFVSLLFLLPGIYLLGAEVVRWRNSRSKVGDLMDESGEVDDGCP
jgi:hypothetical protein